MRTDTSYSPDKGSDTQSTVISLIVKRITKRASIYAKISDRNATYLLAAVIDALELDPVNSNISRSFVKAIYLQLHDRKSPVKFGKTSRQYPYLSTGTENCFLIPLDKLQLIDFQLSFLELVLNKC